MKKHLFAFIMLLCFSFSLTAVKNAVAYDTSFSDIPSGAWYAEAVEYVCQNGLMSGTSDNTFSPNAPASRAMLAAILYRHAGTPAAQAPSFSDVPPDSWYARAVGWASASGIASGDGNGRFSPDSPITREQLASVLWRLEGSPAAQNAVTFQDQRAISSYAAPAVAWVQDKGIISGRQGNLFDPQGHTTRAELSAVLYRWLNGSPSAEPETPPGQKGKILVAWFSRTGNTKAVADTVAGLTGGDLFELIPEKPYPSDYNAVLTQAQQELNDNARPALTSRLEDISQYDVIFIGFPIWHGNTPMLVRTFLEEYDFTGKTIVPFSTSGSSGIQTAEREIHALCPDAEVLTGLSITGSTLHQADSLVSDWITGLNLLKEGETTVVTDKEDEPKLVLQIGTQTFPVTLEENDAAHELIKRLPMTLTMEELNGNEKYSYLSDPLPSTPSRPDTIRKGDIMLFGKDCLVLFYQTFSSSFSYTRLGSIDNPEGFENAVGGGGVTVTFYMK